MKTQRDYGLDYGKSMIFPLKNKRYILFIYRSFSDAGFHVIATIVEKIVPAIVAIDGFHPLRFVAIVEKVSRGLGSDNIVRAISKFNTG